MPESSSTITWGSCTNVWLVMSKSPKIRDEPEGDPKRGDEILRRMLKTKPKPHKEMVKGRKNADGKPKSK